MIKKTIEITDGDRVIPVTFNADMSFGTFMPIINRCVDLKTLLSGQPEINLERLGREITVAAIMEPTELKSPDEFAKLGIRAAIELVSKVMREYPISDFLAKIIAASGLVEATRGPRKRK